jgi:hypothetical protein
MDFYCECVGKFDIYKNDFVKKKEKKNNVLKLPYEKKKWNIFPFLMKTSTLLVWG